MRPERKGAIPSVNVFFSHRHHDMTVLSCLVHVGGLNRIGDNSRLSATENFCNCFVQS